MSRPPQVPGAGPVVAYDAGPALGSPTGVGRYARELGERLDARGVELRRYAVSWRAPQDPSVARWRVPARLAQVSWRRLGRPAIERLTGPADLVHATNFVLPVLARARGAVTVHDLSFYRDDAFPGRVRLRDLVPWSLRRAAVVLVPTRAIAAEVTDHFRLAEDRVVVTHEGVSPIFFGATPLGSDALADLGIRGPYAVAVGTIEPRKNLARLLQAWSRAADELQGWTLVLAGPRGWGPELPRTPGVLPVGWVGDATLPGLLAGAELFCYPSLYEGFGLPPLEAMAAGTPALVGRYSAAPEVLQDAVLLVDPHDVDAIEAGLRRLATDGAYRRGLVVSGRALASTYTWEATARATIAGYERALEP